MLFFSCREFDLHQNLEFLYLDTNMSSPQYCPGNTSLTPVWVDDGISRCFLATVFSSTLLFLLLIPGGVQILLYLRRAEKVEERFIVRPLWFHLQIALSIMMVLQYCAWMVTLEVLGMIFNFIVFIRQKKYIYQLITGFSKKRRMRKDTITQNLTGLVVPTYVSDQTDEPLYSWLCTAGL